MFSWKWSSFIFGCKFHCWPMAILRRNKQSCFAVISTEFLSFSTGHRSVTDQTYSVPYIHWSQFIVLLCLVSLEDVDETLREMICNLQNVHLGGVFSSLLDRKSESKHDTTNEPDLKMRSDQLPKTPLYTPTFCPDPVGNSIKYSSP